MKQQWTESPAGNSRFAKAGVRASMKVKCKIQALCI